MDLELKQRMQLVHHIGFVPFTIAIIVFNGILRITTLLRLGYETSAKEAVTTYRPHVFLALDRTIHLTAVVSTGNNGVCVITAFAHLSAIASTNLVSFPIINRLLSGHSPARHGKGQIGPSDEAATTAASQGAGVGIAHALEAQQRLLDKDDGPCLYGTGGDEVSAPRFIITTLVQGLHIVSIRQVTGRFLRAVFDARQGSRGDAGQADRTLGTLQIKLQNMQIYLRSEEWSGLAIVRSRPCDARRPWLD